MELTQTTIDPALLQSLGKVVPTTPPERPTVRPDTGSKPFGIVEALNPPKVFEFGVDLSVPSKK